MKITKPDWLIKSFRITIFRIRIHEHEEFHPHQNTEQIDVSPNVLKATVIGLTNRLTTNQNTWVSKDDNLKDTASSAIIQPSK